MRRGQATSGRASPSPSSQDAAVPPGFATSAGIDRATLRTVSWHEA